MLAGQLACAAQLMNAHNNHNDLQTKRWARVQAPVDVDLAQQQAVAPAKMLVPQLKEQLKTFNMPVSGKKADLVHRLETALAAAAATGHASDAMSPDTAVTSGTTAGDAVPEAAARDGQGVSASAVLDGQSEADLEGVSDDVRPDGSGEGEAKGRRGKGKQKAVGGVQPGTQGLGDVMTAEVSCMPCSAANLLLFQRVQHHVDMVYRKHGTSCCVNGIYHQSTCYQARNVSRHVWRCHCYVSVS